jgi:antitoxin YefM
MILYMFSVSAEGVMATRATYSRARANFAKIWNEVEESREPAILERRGHESMALLPADELSSLQETAHLLRSPKNAARLLAALARSQRQETPAVELETLMEELRLSD